MPSTDGGNCFMQSFTMSFNAYSTFLALYILKHIRINDGEVPRVRGEVFDTARLLLWPTSSQPHQRTDEGVMFAKPRFRCNRASQYRSTMSIFLCDCGRNRRSIMLHVRRLAEHWPLRSRDVDVPGEQHWRNKNRQPDNTHSHWNVRCAPSTEAATRADYLGAPRHGRPPWAPRECTKRPQRCKLQFLHVEKRSKNWTWRLRAVHQTTSTQSANLTTTCFCCKNCFRHKHTPSVLHVRDTKKECKLNHMADKKEGLTLLLRKCNHGCASDHYQLATACRSKLQRLRSEIEAVCHNMPWIFFLSQCGACVRGWVTTDCHDCGTESMLCTYVHCHCLQQVWILTLAAVMWDCVHSRVVFYNVPSERDSAFALLQKRF